MSVPGGSWEHPSVDDSKEGLTGLSTQSYTWLSVVDCSEKIPSKISKGKRRMGEGWEKPTKCKSARFRSCLSPPARSYDNTCEVLSTRKLAEVQCSEFSLGAGHTGHLCLISVSQKDSRCSAQP